jgi:hypothetical protein
VEDNIRSTHYSIHRFGCANYKDNIMTVSNVTSRTSAVGTNTAGQQIPFTFPISATGDLTVLTRVTATGVEATFTETTDYTVSLTDSGESGGTVTLVAALAATSECHIIRDRSKTQTLDLTQGGDFNAENVEDALDRVCTHTIDNDDAIFRSLRAPSTDDSTVDMEIPNAVDRRNQYLAFTDTAAASPTVVSSVAPTTATITAFSETYLDDANAAAVRTTLGIAIGTDVQAYDAQLDDIAALAVTDGNIIVGDGSNWVAESGATARTSLGVPAATATPLTDNIMVMAGDIITMAGNVITLNQRTV